MKNKLILISLILVVISLLVVNISLSKETENSPENNTVTQTVSVNPTPIPTSIPVTPADKIEVVNFFGTQRCVSCLTLGKLSKKTIEEKFADEVKSGRIAFKEINDELPENKMIVIKYQARGSSLFINAIRGEKEDIEEDVTVWRLINNEAQFISYLENKLNKLLGK